MTKHRAIRNTKHRIAKAYRRIMRTGDDWSASTNKQFLETDRQKAKEEVKEQLGETTSESARRE